MAGVPVLLASIVLALLPSCRPGQPGDPRGVGRKLAPGDPGIELPGGSSEDAIARADALRDAVAEGADPGPVLLSGLNDGDDLVRGTTVSLLLTAETGLVRKVLVTYQARRGPLYERDRPAELRLLASELVGRRDLGDVIDRTAVCRAALDDTDPLIRSRVAGRCAEAGLLDDAALERLAGDPHWAVRTRLASALAGTADSGATCRTLRRLADDTHATVRTAARRAGGRCSRGNPENSR